MIFSRYLLIAATLLLGAGTVSADPIAGAPTAPESILLIYTSCTPFNVDLKETVKNALLSLPVPAQVTEVLIAPGDGTAPGIYDELLAQTGKTDLSDWCQVWDLRFRDDLASQNVAWTGQAHEDVLTMTGANSDWNLFDAYLKAGGHMYFQGEHGEFYIRNANLIMFINHIAAAPITVPYATVGPSYGGAIVPVGNFPATPDNFNSDFNNLGTGTLNGFWPGGIPLTDIGSGRPLGTASMQNTSTGQLVPAAMALAYLPGDLKVNDGRVVVNFEANAFSDASYLNATSTAWMQNVYDLLGGCYRYSLEKQFVPDTARVNENGTFMIRYENFKQPLINFRVTDTIPTCIEFLSSEPPPSGNSGNVFWWDIPSVPTNTRDSVVVHFKTTQLPPCP